MAFIRTKKFDSRIYYYLVENQRINGKTKQKVIRYLGKSEHVKSGKEVFTAKNVIETLKVHDVLDYGEIAVQHKIFQMLDITKIINKHTIKGGGNIDVGTLSEIMAINRNSVPCSRRKIPVWYKQTALPILLGISPGEINDRLLLRTFQYLQESYTLPIQKEIYEQIKQVFNIKPTRVFYDLTSSYFEGCSCALSAYGHSCDHRPDKLQIIVGFVVDQNGILITHSIHKGNTVGVSTLDEIAGRLKDVFDIGDFVLVVDRGMLSTGNIEKMDLKKYRYVFAHKLNAKEKKVVDNLLMNGVWKQIDDDGAKASFLITEEHGRRKQFVVGYSDTMRSDDHMYREFTLQRAENELKKLQETIKKGKVKNKKTIAGRIGHILRRYKVTRYIEIIYSEEEVDYGFRRRKKVIDEQARYDGIYVLSTSELDLDPGEVIRVYKERDLIEKAIRTIKSVIDLRPFYVYSDESVIGHVFICALAYQVRSVMKYMMKKSDVDMSVEEAFDILSRLKVVNISLQGDEVTVYRKLSSIEDHTIVDVFEIKTDGMPL